MATLLTAPEAPERLASGEQAIEISDEIQSFPRLEDALDDELGQLESAQIPVDWRLRPVKGELRFAFADAQSREVMARMDARVSLPLVCQRCLEPFDQTLEVTSRVLIVDDEKKAGSDDVEAWEIDGGLLRPIDLVDELLVMAMPFAAKHADARVCGVEFEEQAVAEDKVRPFADLRAQLEAAGPAGDTADGRDNE